MLGFPLLHIPSLFRHCNSPSQTQLFEESARRRVVFAEPLLRTVVTVFLAERCDALNNSAGKVLWI
jgi:hypothetical protein